MEMKGWNECQIIAPKQGSTDGLSRTIFTLWAPTATEVRLNLYSQGDGGARIAQHKLLRGSDGTWSLELCSNLQGMFYTFQVRVDGKWLDETPGVFAKAVGVNGKRAQVLDLSTTDPEGWAQDVRPELRSFADIVLYEMHHRDFSVDVESGVQHPGKYLALTETGTRNAAGLATGIDHLKELGITHVHLLPSYDFGSINEAQTFLHDSYAHIGAETDGVPAQYNWGYDPVNYNVPDGGYSTNPYEPAVRICEFKQMVLALHRAGIRVVLDVVYNHVYDAATSPFERTVPGYFFRHRIDGSHSNGSGCGNETASNQPMMRRYMIESVMYWAREYHIDGFRFDLMGVHDIETMRQIRQALDTIDPSIFIYGEGWAASTPAMPAALLAMKANTAQMPGVAAFGDELRDGLRGSWTDDREGGFLVGCKGNEESLKFGIVGAVWHPQVDYTHVNYSEKAWAAEPTQMISYVSCHDDMCLHDRIQTTLAALRFGHGFKPSDIRRLPKSELASLQKLAETAVLTSQGVPFLWCGDELMRSKKLVHNSYNSPDSINTIPWSLKTENHDLFEYVRSLIAMRRAHPVFRMGTAELVRSNLEFLPARPGLIAYCMNGNAVGDEWGVTIVILNSDRRARRIDIPRGNYTIVCRNGEISADGLASFSGSRITIPAQSALILHQ